MQGILKLRDHPEKNTLGWSAGTAVFVQLVYGLPYTTDRGDR